LIPYAGNRTIDGNNHQYVFLEAILMLNCAKYYHSRNENLVTPEIKITTPENLEEEEGR
jgi:hypothetical protein